MSTVPTAVTVAIRIELPNQVVYLLSRSSVKFSALTVRNRSFDPVSVPPGFSDAEIRYTKGRRQMTTITTPTTCRQPTSRHQRSPFGLNWPVEVLTGGSTVVVVAVVITAPRD